MAAQSLLEIIDVDKLFEQHNVKEIDQIHKKLQSDVEQKKEELRMMVGERYRDLLKAADTIGHMKQTATTLTHHVEEIVSSCRNLKHQQLIGFQLDRPVDRVAEKAANNFYGIAVQIKILTQLPELIWSRIDQLDFLVATELFIFARHISTGLHLDKNKEITCSIPVAAKLWSTLSAFFYIIKQSCLKVLEYESLDPLAAAKCLASILLLDNCPCDQLLTKFIKLRVKAFKNTLTEDSKEHDRVKNRILNSVHILMDTINLIHECFVSSGNSKPGLIITELNQLNSNESLPTISFIIDENPAMFKLLPEIIFNFKPHIEIADITHNSLKTLMQNWLQISKQDADYHLKLLVGAVASVKTIHQIKMEVFLIENSYNWNTVLEHLYLPPNLNLYQFYYQPLINARVKEIIATSWKEVINGTLDEIKSLLEMEEKHVNDAKLYLWTEDTSDIPLSLKQALSNDKHKHLLLLRTKGYNSKIFSICQSLNTKLRTLVEELELFLCENDDRLKLGVTLQTDIDGVMTFLRHTAKLGIIELIQNIKTIEYKKNQSSFIFLAKILQSLTELCPNLKACFFKDIASNWDRNSFVDLEHWENTCRLLEAESLQFWNLWIELFVSNLTTADVCFTGCTNLVTATKELTNWERITIEEIDDEGNPIKSVIRVPSQPSVSLQTFLCRVCSNLNYTLPHNLPKNVIHLLADQIALALIQTYQIFSQSKFLRFSQNTSLQYFFDVKFINVIFGQPESKLLVEKLQNLAAVFKENVDPFDFELFHKYLMINVKKSALQMQQKLGSIITNEPVLINQQSWTSREKDPNVLALSTFNSTRAWFPLLPVIPVKTISQDTNQKAQTKNSNTNQSQVLQQQHQSLYSGQNLSNVRSGAAAFFGGLSQDWFR